MGRAGGGVLISDHQTRRRSCAHRSVVRDLEAAASAKGLDEAQRCNVLRGTWFHPPSHAIVQGTGGRGMSWPELERLVADAEASQDLRETWRHCRSPEDLLLAVRRQGYRVRASTGRTPGLSISSARKQRFTMLCQALLLGAEIQALIAD